MSVDEPTPIAVGIWSDLICPFCNVARERAAWLRGQPGVTVTFLPYLLHPEYPPEGVPRADVLQALPAEAGVARTMAEEAGLAYNPHPERIPNSRTALELVEWARGQGREQHDILHDRVMDAYWSEGRDISDWDELEQLVGEVGLDPVQARAAVESGELAPAVVGSTLNAQRNGIRAVPAFVFAGRLLVNGVVPREVLATALERVRADGGQEPAG